MINILIAGNATMISKMATPTIPTVFFNNTEALNHSIGCIGKHSPITGIKLPVTNFAVRIAIPSVTAADAP